MAVNPGAVAEDVVEATWTADASRNDEDNLRLGPWHLVDRAGDHVLTLDRGGGPAHVTAIYIEKTDAGDWRVTDVGEEHYRFD